MSSDDLATFSLAPFLRELCDKVSASFGAVGSGVRIVVDADALIADLDFAIPLGLLATELLSNAIKHARASVVTIELRQTAGRVVLAVGDDGRGAGSTRLAARTGVGSRIIEGLTRQIGGRMEIVHQEGMRVEICMPLPETA
jgi:two-component sensor histidine kinase